MRLPVNRNLYATSQYFIYITYKEIYVNGTQSKSNNVNV